MDSLSKFFAKSVTVLGSIGGAAFMWIGQNPQASGVWEGLGVIGLGSAVVGGIGWFKEHRRLKRDYAKRREQRLISVAKENHGRITDVELVAETRYPLEECREFLKQMAESGSAEMHIGDGGTIVYLFPGFLTDEEKRNAKPALDWSSSPTESTSSDEKPPALPSRSLEIE